MKLALMAFALALPLAAAPITFATSGAITQTGEDTYFLNLHNSNFYGFVTATLTPLQPVTSLVIDFDNGPYLPGTGVCLQTNWTDYGCVGAGTHFVGSLTVTAAQGEWLRFSTLRPFDGFWRERATVTVRGAVVQVPEPSTWVELGLAAVVALGVLFLFVNKAGSKEKPKQ